MTTAMDKKIDPSNKDCAYCETSGAKLTCAKCKAAHYCSKACQKQHWKNGHREGVSLLRGGDLKLRR